MLQESVEEDYAEMLGITAISRNELAEPTGKIYDWANDNEEGAPEETIIMKQAFNKSTDEIVQEAAAINRREQAGTNTSSCLHWSLSCPLSF